MSSPPTTVVIPSWNGRRWLPGLLATLAAQSRPPAATVVVDNGSRDGTAGWLASAHPEVTVIALPENTGFAHAANIGLRAARTELVALVNTDVELAPEWLERIAGALAAAPRAASAASKLVSLADPSVIDDAGDVLRRDGACEQRGRYTRDDGRYDAPGEVFGACAGAALYRRTAVLAVGGFDERLFAYLEDAELALRLRLAGHTCVYVPDAVARHAGGGSGDAVGGPAGRSALVARNTVLIVAAYWPWRWLGYVAYRQAGWAWHAARERRLAAHLRGLAAALPRLPRALAARRRIRAGARVPIDAVVPPMAIRGPRALGHPSRHARATGGGG